MSSVDRSQCTLATCDVTKLGYYQYVPNTGANVLFLVIFALLAIVQAFLSLRYRVWGVFAGGLVVGCLGEAIGYVGRTLESRGNGIFQKKYFVIQLVCLTISPAFLSAVIYLSLGRVVKAYGRKFSLLSPKTYAVIFICSDLVSLALQAAGGAIASGAQTPQKQDTGVHIMVAGLAFQVVSLAVFVGLAVDVWLRVIREGRSSFNLNQRFEGLRRSKQFKYFIGALCVSTLTITIRCIYRVIELAGGFKSAEANNQVTLMILDGAMITIAVLALTFFHPGPLFLDEWNRLGKDSGHPDHDIENKVAQKEPFLRVQER